ncbi:MAG: vitamin K epoxide reductase family protein [Thermoanaerobaculales bacterium]
MNAPRSAAFAALVAFALAGVVFAAVSTYDYVAHLDRQVHAITCSFIPGVGAADTTGTSGCHAVLMSPYSAVLRSFTWGGIPIALPALAVFAYLLYRALRLLLSGTAGDADETRFTLVAAVLPVVVSLVYLFLSITRVGTLCKLCVGIYAASAGTCIAALLAHRAAARPTAETPARGLPWGRYLIDLAEGTAFVLVPVVLYLTLKPAWAESMARCGELSHPEDRYGVRVKLPGGEVPAIEVLDPLCPACKGFYQRLAASGLGERLAPELVLFPLDKECNWMVNTSLHPGACAISEAVLCGGIHARDVLEWTFANQEELRALGGDPTALAARIKQRFPELAGCLGQPAVRTRLNRSLRWAVANSLPVVTPQLFVRGEKVCEEDTDLGLEFVLARVLETPAAPKAR